MAKNKALPEPATSSSSGRSFWPAAIMIALLSGSTGALVTYVILEPRWSHAPVPSPTPVSAVAAVRAPDASITAGQPPAQSDRTLGNFYYDRSDWVQAVKYYESAIRQGSDDADIRTDLGNAYRFSNRADDALAQYRVAQGMNPQHEVSLFNQGGLYFEQFRDPAKAIAIWNDYLRRFPQGSSAAAARQLIAQAQAAGPAAIPPPLGVAPAPSTNPFNGAPVDPTEARLLQLVKPKP